MDKDTTTAIKGIALIMMFVHHFFTFPEWYTEGISYVGLQTFAEVFQSPLKLCVSVYAFLTGYFYFYTRQKNYRYSFRKITDFLLSYWIIYFPLLAVSVLLGCLHPGPREILYELVGLDGPVMIFCWYVPFYCCVMLVLPLAAGSDKQDPVRDVLAVLVLPVAVAFCLMRFVTQRMVGEILYNFSVWFPCVASGFLCAKYDLFGRFLDKRMNETGAKWKKGLGYGLLFLLAFFGRNLCPFVYFGKNGPQWPMDILYAPLFVYVTAKAVQHIKECRGFRVLQEIGKKSMLMWFLHCAFFNCCAEVTQKLLYWPRNPVLVLLFGLLLCYTAAALAEPVLKYLQEKKNGLKIFRFEY